MIWSRLPAAWSRSSSVSCPHFSLTLPLNCFQLPSIWSQFIAVPPERETEISWNTTKQMQCQTFVTEGHEARPSRLSPTNHAIGSAGSDRVLAAHNADALAGESPVVGIDCLPT